MGWRGLTWAKLAVIREKLETQTRLNRAGTKARRGQLRHGKWDWFRLSVTLSDDAAVSDSDSQRLLEFGRISPLEVMLWLYMVLHFYVDFAAILT